MSLTLDPNLNFTRANLSVPDTAAVNSLVTTQPFSRLQVAITGTGLVDVRGLASPAAWQLRVFVMIGPGTITFKHQHASASAAERFAFVGATDRALTDGGQLMVIYDPNISRWRDI